MNAAALMNKPHMFLLSFMNAIVGSRLSLIILLEFVHANIPSFVCVWGRMFSLLN
jgi:hypothetical protein